MNRINIAASAWAVVKEEAGLDPSTFTETAEDEEVMVDFENLADCADAFKRIVEFSLKRGLSEIEHAYIDMLPQDDF